MITDQLARLRDIAEAACDAVVPWDFSHDRLGKDRNWLAFHDAASPDVVLALLDEVERLRGDVIGLRQDLDHATGPHCSSCGNSIDPDWCHCGDAVESHGAGDGHAPVPMGCVCGYAEPDWKSLARSRGEFMWKQQRHFGRVQAERDSFAKLAMERYDDLEALHAELGQPYQSVTVQNLRAERDDFAQRADDMEEQLRSAIETGTAEIEALAAERDALAQECEKLKLDRLHWLDAATRVQRQRDRLLEILSRATHKLGYLLRDCPGDKETRGLIAEVAALASEPTP